MCLFDLFNSNKDANTATHPTLDPPLTHTTGRWTSQKARSWLSRIFLSVLSFFLSILQNQRNTKLQDINIKQRAGNIPNPHTHTRPASGVKTDKEQSPCAHQSCSLPASRANSFPFLPLHSYVTDICCITLSVSHWSWFWALRLFHSSLLFSLSTKLGVSSWKGYCMIDTDWWSKISAGLTCVCSPRPSDEALQPMFEECETASIDENHSKSNAHANTSRPQQLHICNIIVTLHYNESLCIYSTYVFVWMCVGWIQRVDLSSTEERAGMSESKCLCSCPDNSTYLTCASACMKMNSHFLAKALCSLARFSWMKETEINKREKESKLQTSSIKNGKSTWIILNKS